MKGQERRVRSSLTGKQANALQSSGKKNFVCLSIPFPPL